MNNWKYETGMTRWHADADDLLAQERRIPDEQVPVIALVGIYVVTHKIPKNRTVRDWRQTVLKDTDTVSMFERLVPGSADSLEDTVPYPITKSPFYLAGGLRHQVLATHIAIIDGTIAQDNINGAEEYLSITAGYAAYNHAIGFRPLHINLTVAGDPLRQFFPKSLAFMQQEVRL
jgi:hypothetical protein